MQEETPGWTKAPLAHTSEQTPTVRGASRGSAEQRRTEQSWRTGKRWTEQRQHRDSVPSDLAADGPADTGGRQRSPRWQGVRQQPGTCAHSSPQQAATGSKIPVYTQLLSALEPPALEVQNAAGFGERGGFTPCLHPLSYLQSILGGKLSSACCPACHGDAK